MTSPHSGSKIGNFVRADLAGRDHLFYGIALGQPVILVHGNAASAISALPAIEAATANAPADTTVLYVLNGSHEDLQEAERAVGESLVLVDADDAVHRFLTQQDSHPLALTVIDRRLSIVGTEQFPISAQNGDAPETVCDQMHTLLARTAQTVDLPAPVLQTPTLLTNEECRALINHFDESASVPSPSHIYEDGSVKLALDATQKVRQDYIVEDDQVNGWLMSLLSERLLPDVQSAFNFQPKGAEKFKIVTYPAAEGGHFAVHRDNVTPDASNRRFAVTVNLNTHSYEGGGLLFPEYTTTPVSPPAGGSVVFSCSLAHRVLPVTHGVRYALITFLTV